MAGKGDIFGVNMQEVYLSKRLMTSVAGQDGAQPVISVTDGHGAAVGKSFYAVTAISYCDLHKISLSDLTATLDVYPEFANQFLYNFYITFNLRQVRSKRVHFRKKNIAFSYKKFFQSMQCFDTVGWVKGRTSCLKKS